MSRKGTLRGAGHIWHSTPCNPSDGWTTNLNERVRLTTWKFGSIHQCVLDIAYDHCRGGIRGNEVHIGLEPNKTVQEAMHHLVEWGTNFIEAEPKSVEQVFADCFAHWPDLYETRIDVINHLFFTIGGGYDWLDGAIINTGPEDHIGAKERDEYRRKNPTPQDIKSINLYKKLINNPETSKEVREICKDALDLFEGLYGEEKDHKRPLPDDGLPRTFYPVCNYSNITRVPDDVRPDWLALSYEAAILLRDRSGLSEKPHEHDEQWNARNKETAVRIIEELEGRFPQLKNRKASFEELWVKAQAFDAQDRWRREGGIKAYDEWNAILKENGWTHREWYEAVSDFKGFKRPE